MHSDSARVLMGAQFWAYGPASKASAIAHSLRLKKILVDFVGTKTSYQLCKDSGFFQKIYPLDKNSDLEKLRPYELVISVMDPYVALWGYKNGTPVLYADSMSWFWRWTDNDAHKAKKIITELNRVGFVEGGKILDKLKPDQRQLIAHVISNKVLTQGAPHHVPGLLTKARNVGSMIDLNFRKKTKRDTLLISLSGGVSPATPLAAAIRYANLVIRLIQPLLAKGTEDWKRVVITGNPLVIANLKSCPKPFQAIALPQKTFLQELNRALVVLVPCGFTTVYESLAYGAPLMFLPENHNGHLYEYLTITKGVASLSQKEKVFPHAFFGIAGVDLKNRLNSKNGCFYFANIS